MGSKWAKNNATGPRNLITSFKRRLELWFAVSISKTDVSFFWESANYTCVQQHTARKMLGRKDKKKERDYLPPSLLPFFSLFQESIRKGSASFLRTDLPVKTFLKENKFLPPFLLRKINFRANFRIFKEK